MGFGHLLPNTSITQKFGGKEKGFYEKVAQFGAPSLQGNLFCKTQREPSHPQYQSSVQTAHSLYSYLSSWGPGCYVYGFLSSAPLSLECVLLGWCLHCLAIASSFSWGQGMLPDHCSQLCQGIPFMGPWHSRLLATLELVNAHSPGICVLLSEPRKGVIWAPCHAAWSCSIS